MAPGWETGAAGTPGRLGVYDHFHWAHRVTKQVSTLPGVLDVASEKPNLKM